MTKSTLYRSTWFCKSSGSLINSCCQQPKRIMIFWDLVWLLYSVQRRMKRRLHYVRIKKTPISLHIPVGWCFHCSHRQFSRHSERRTWKWRLGWTADWITGLLLNILITHGLRKLSKELYVDKNWAVMNEKRSEGMHRQSLHLYRSFENIDISGFIEVALK